MGSNRRFWSWRPLCAAAALCVGVAGCADFNPGGADGPQAEAAPAAEPTTQASPPANPKLPAEKPRRQASLPPDGKPETRLPVLGPEMLVGLDQGQIELLLGPPLDVREQPPATVWSYRAKNCALNVFFYPDLQTREVRALAYDVRAGSEAEQSKNACFAALRARAKE